MRSCTPQKQPPAKTARSVETVMSISLKAPSALRSPLDILHDRAIRGTKIELARRAKPRMEQKVRFRVTGGKSGGSHGSDNALPQMRKTIGPGCHPLRPYRPAMHQL